MFNKVIPYTLQVVLFPTYIWPSTKYNFKNYSFIKFRSYYYYVCLFVCVAQDRYKMRWVSCKWAWVCMINTISKSQKGARHADAEGQPQIVIAYVPKKWCHPLNLTALKLIKKNKGGNGRRSSGLDRRRHTPGFVFARLWMRRKAFAIKDTWVMGCV